MALLTILPQAQLYRLFVALIRGTCLPENRIHLPVILETLTAISYLADKLVLSQVGKGGPLWWLAPGCVGWSVASSFEVNLLSRHPSRVNVLQGR